MAPQEPLAQSLSALSQFFVGDKTMHETLDRVTQLAAEALPAAVAYAGHVIANGNTLGVIIHGPSILADAHVRLSDTDPSTPAGMLLPDIGIRTLRGVHAGHLARHADGKSPLRGRTVVDHVAQGPGVPALRVARRGGADHAAALRRALPRARPCSPRS